jgi:pimeloyl-ACP methyl ester carboxylesterase
MSKKQSFNPLNYLLTGLAAVAGGWIAYSRYFVNHSMTLPPALPAPRETFVGETTGLISYYHEHQGDRQTPLLLIHSINAGASAYEMRPIFMHYRQLRPIYVMDMPGFGFSDRSDRVYSVELYTQAVIDMLEHIGQPVAVVALSLSSEFAARAALQRPELFTSLTMISPSGFNRPDRSRSSQIAAQLGFDQAVYNTLSYPLWGHAFFDLLATKPSIHWFLQQSFIGQVDKGLEEYAYLSAHQPGAHFAPLYFVSGKLFTRDIREEVYEKLTIPVMVIYDEDPYVSFDYLRPFVAKHPNWQAKLIVPTRGLPQFEKMTELAQALNTFWGERVSISSV